MLPVLDAVAATSSADASVPLTLVVPVVGALVSAIVYLQRRLAKLVDAQEKRLDDLISDIRKHAGDAEGK